MKIAVLNNSVPFLRGGAEDLADALVREFEARGHDAELVKVPLRWASPLQVAESMVAAASLRIPQADLVVALKFPAYLVPHPRKVIWLLHQFRQVYDLWGTDLQDIPSDRQGQRLRAAIREADMQAFSESRSIFCNSTVTANRLRDYNGVGSTVLLPPHREAGSFRPGPYGDYVLAIGRVNEAKRQHLLVEAMAHAPAGVRLVVAGSPETDGDVRKIHDLIDKHGLADRVQLVARYISDEEKVSLLAGARAVAYVPVDEDSYGYVTAEAMMSAKPVITCSDSGGVLELVRDGVTGWIAPPSPEELGLVISECAADPERCASLGALARQAVDDLDLSWDRTIDRLLQ